MYHKCIKPVWADQVIELFKEGPFSAGPGFTKIMFTAHGYSGCAMVTLKYLKERETILCRTNRHKQNIGRDNREVERGMQLNMEDKKALGGPRFMGQRLKRFRDYFFFKRRHLPHRKAGYSVHNVKSRDLRNILSKVDELGRCPKL